jgi:hypothetical protein
VRRAILIAVSALPLTLSMVHAQARDPLDIGPALLNAQPRNVVDMPTAGLPSRAGFYVEADIYSDGALLVGLGVGFAGYFTFGISYGGVRVIGSGDPEMNPLPGVQARARLIEEGLVTPAIAIGFDSQGRGPYIEDEERYLMKSLGVYAVASKNWDLWGPFSLHGGMAYSLEKGDNDPTVFLGAIKSFSGFLDLRLEYDFAFNNDRADEAFAEDRGFLNASVVWHVNERFSLSLEARDIATEDKVEVEDLREWNRGLGIVYRGLL